MLLDSCGCFKDHVVLRIGVAVARVSFHFNPSKNYLATGLVQQPNVCHGKSATISGRCDSRKLLEQSFPHWWNKTTLQNLVHDSAERDKKFERNKLQKFCHQSTHICNLARFHASWSAKLIQEMFLSCQGTWYPPSSLDSDKSAWLYWGLFCINDWISAPSNANALFPAGCFRSPELLFWHSRVAFCMVSSENKRR